ncbi:hypothetical protein [Paenibacillus sp. R14(2021)]|uniref:hypothetical protein n=1 Tax=Paenibacillus sp. R14(2021) TaxID=2859228 RepID=UPI001C6114F1|nr:hypothetical protein [Paenibacillus sp. R14(2021)]
MRTIYENYRGFKVYQQTNTYNAVSHHDQEIIFCHWQLIKVLNTIDSYIDK